MSDNLFLTQEKANKLVDGYVKKVALKDFQRPFLHQAKFFPFQAHTGTAGQVRFPRDNAPVMELYARHFASPRFIKTVRHELIHYFLFMDKKPHGHNKEFKEWSCRVDAGGTYHHEGDEFLYFRGYCPVCGLIKRIRYGDDEKQMNCLKCEHLGFEIDNLFGMNEIWIKQADTARKKIIDNPRYIVLLPDGSYLRSEMSQHLLKVPKVTTSTMRSAYVTSDHSKALKRAERYSGQVKKYYTADHEFIESPYIYQCKECKRIERKDSPFLLNHLVCGRCKGESFIFKGIK